jgi:hypothetical protein
MRHGRVWAMAAGALAVMVLLIAAVLIVRGQQPANRLSGHPSCGQVVNLGLNYDSRPPDCLWQAYMSGAAADAIMVNYTTEGDPVSYGVNIVSKERIQVSIQSHDRYGPQGSFAYVCQAMTRQPAAQLPGRFYLLLTGCSGPPDFLDGTRLTIP